MVAYANPKPITTPKRIQLRRTKGWRKPVGVIVVSRPSRWGNPYAADIFGHERCLKLFDNSVRGVWDPGVVNILPTHHRKLAYALHCEFKKRFGGSHPTECARTELRNRDLACWCALTERCHADILLKVANA